MSCAISPINNQAASDELQDKLKGDYRAIHPETIVIPDDRLRKIDPKSIPALADSFKEVGQICAIGVKRHGQNQYRVVYGARRVLAMQMLFKQAMEKAKDPNTDQDVQRFSSMHAIVYRNETDDNTCRRLEIRENLDRQELSARERTAHELRLAAIEKEEEASNGHVDNGKSFMKKTNPPKRKAGKPQHVIARKVAAATNVEPHSVMSRVRAANAELGRPKDKQISMETSSPDELRAAANELESKPVIKPASGAKRDTPAKGTAQRNGGTLMTCGVSPSAAPKFATWIKRRYPASFTLDQIRAFRDALTNLVQELEGGQS